ncbi:MAG: hypothetical protein PHX93_06250 [Candidatus Peribacteraceae bacterium]|jgi:hypothetical protein|nr:hypothetical protein [Candidatus Peribacteraceae bacterium]
MKKIPFFIGLLLPLALVAGLQWSIDPLLVFSREEGGDWWWKQPRLSMPYVMRRVKPASMSMGSSRAGSIPITHRGWNGQRVMKLVLPGATYSEERQFLEHAQAIHPLRVVTLETSYENIYNKIPGQFDPDRLLRVTGQNNRLRFGLRVIQDYMTVLFSADSIEEGIMEFFEVAWTPRLQYYERLDALRKVYGTTGEGNKNNQEDPMKELKDMLTFASDHKIQMYIFISPLRAPYEESEYRRIGFEKTEQWKRDLMRLLTEEKRRSGYTHPLWDFSGYNTVTLEEVPPSGVFYDMRWFSDAAHFKEVTGAMILDRLFDTCAEPCEIPEDFGVQLTPENIEEHLAKVRADRVEYLQTHKAPAY